MKKLLLNGFLILAVAALFLSVGLEKYSAAQPVGFPNVMPFVTPSGLVGLFDQKDGKMYLYDANLEECFMISQVNTLGEPLTRVK